MEQRDQFSSLFWLGISILIVCGGVAIRGNVGTFHYPGPGFLPFWSGVGLGVSSIILLIKSMAMKKAEGKVAQLIGKEWSNIVWVIVSLFLYAILLESLGYLIATFGLMVLLFSLMGKIRLWIRVGSAVITSLVTYLIFNVWFQSQLPEGLFGFNF